MPRTPSLQLSGGIKSLIPLKIPTSELWDSPPAHHLFLRNKIHQASSESRDQHGRGIPEISLRRGGRRGGHREETGQEAKMQRGERKSNLKAMDLECIRGER